MLRKTESLLSKFFLKHEEVIKPLAEPRSNKWQIVHSFLTRKSEASPHRVKLD